MNKKSHATRLSPLNSKTTDRADKSYSSLSLATLTKLAFAIGGLGLVSLSYQAVSSETVQERLPMFETLRLIPESTPVDSGTIAYEFINDDEIIVIPAVAKLDMEHQNNNSDKEGHSKDVELKDEKKTSKAVSAEKKKETTNNSTPKTTKKSDSNKTTATINDGDTFPTIAVKYGLTINDAYNIAANKKAKKILDRLYKDTQLNFVTKDEKNNKSFVSLQFRLNTSKQMKVTRNTSGKGFNFKEISDPMERRVLTAQGRVNSSLYVDATEAGLPDRMVMTLVEMFQWEIDFSREVRKGDEFKMVYEAYFRDNKLQEYGNIIAAEYINNDKTYNGYYFTPKGKSPGYYTAKGTNLSKAFLRNPVDVVRITSRFNLKRKHPVLHKIRAHKGVDYGAKTGTPIRATSRGVISHLGRKGGYGRTVVIKHGTKYTTLYAHMSRYGKGLKKGMKVKRGQVIGYVGSSGLATGPHLHYEFRSSGKHVDPLKIKSIRGDALNKADKRKFTALITPLMKNLASLKIPDDIQVAEKP